MNYKITNLESKESLVTDEIGFTGVIASHTASMGLLLGAIEAQLIRDAVNGGGWQCDKRQMRIERTDDAITNHAVSVGDKWLVTQPTVELGDKQTLDVLVSVSGVEKTLSISLQDLRNGNGWFEARFVGLDGVNLSSMVKVSKMDAPSIETDDNYIEVCFTDFDLIIKLDDEGLALDLLQGDESHVIGSTYALYQELEETDSEAAK